MPDWNEFLSPVQLSIQVSLVSSIIVFILGSIAAWGLVRRSFRGKTALETLFMLPLVLPPTVVGFLLLFSLGKNGALGRLSAALFGRTVIFSWWGAVIAAVVVAFPLVYQTIKIGFASIDKDLEDSARTSGASDWQVLRHVSLPLAWRSLVTGYMLGFARALGEFGATLMVAGNIPGKTQTLPTAIYMAVESGHTVQAWWWTGTIVFVSFLLMILVSRKT